MKVSIITLLIQLVHLLLEAPSPVIRKGVEAWKLALITLIEVKLGATL